MHLFLFGWALSAAFMLAQDAELPQFPRAEACCAIRGVVRADSRMAGQLLEIPEQYRSLFPRGLHDESRRCNPRDLSLPYVVVHVSGLENRWRFSAAKAAHILRIRRSGVTPWRSAVATGQVLRIEGAPAIRRLRQLQELRGSGGIHALRRGSFVKRTPGQLRFRDGKRSWLDARVEVLPHPVFAVSDAQGKFTLPELPAGQYQLVASHVLLGEIEQVVRVPQEKTELVELRFRVPDLMRIGAPFDARKLPVVAFPKDTTAEEKQELTQLAETAMDDYGIRGQRASKELIEHGRKAFPAIVNALRKVDYMDVDHALQAFTLHKAIEQITLGDNVGFKPPRPGEPIRKEDAWWNAKCVKALVRFWKRREQGDPQNWRKYLELRKRRNR